MTLPADREHQSPLEAALVDVRTALVELLVAADEQHAALVARDRDRLESVTRQQERLSARLARAEAKRLELLGGRPLTAALSELSAATAGRIRAMTTSIARAVNALQERQAKNALLLQQSMELTSQTLTFLHNLISPPVPVYGARPVAVTRPSVLVDSRA
jgi:flagellar biosynthesis/type III secretory pathway chaperone